MKKYYCDICGEEIKDFMRVKVRFKPVWIEKDLFFDTAHTSKYMLCKRDADELEKRIADLFKLNTNIKHQEERERKITYDPVTHDKWKNARFNGEEG